MTSARRARGTTSPGDAGGGSASGGHDPGSPSVRHVLDRIGLVEHRVRAEVARRRSQQAASEDDAYLGLYVSDERVARLLDSGPARPIPPDPQAAMRLERIEAAADEAASAGEDLRLRRLARDFDLQPLDVELLLVAAAPSVDARFEPLYGYLNDDVSLHHATVQLALLLCGADPASGAARSRLGHGGPLRRHGLIRIGDLDRPLLSRTVRVADRVVTHLLGIDQPATAVGDLLLPAVGAESSTVAQLVRACGDDADLVYVRDPHAAGGAAAAVAAFGRLDVEPLVLDLTRIRPGTDLRELAGTVALEARLTQRAIVAEPVEALSELADDGVRAFAETGTRVVLVGRTTWDPRWSREVPVVIDAQRPEVAERQRLWHDALEDVDVGELDIARSTASFRLTPLQIDRAALAARKQAEAEDREVTIADLQRGVRAQNAAGLERLARRIEPRVTWQDLIVPAIVETQLRELTLRWRHRDRVLEDWGMGRGVATGRGVSALFAGASGTGKTLAAEVIAGDLALDLYLVDLSTVVDKYIGETSKNLDRIFDEADRVNGVLLFDEADALFGKRSAVSDAKDRHANVEVAFLLQRMETFDGVAILTTNLASNLDDAFLRRLDSIIDFPSPDDDHRRALWEAKLGAGIPCADDVDVGELADLFTLSGSEISNVVVSAAYHAADRDEPVTMRDLVDAAVREHRKLGRHLTAADLGDHANALGSDR